MLVNPRNTTIFCLLLMTLLAAGVANAQQPSFKMLIGNPEAGAVDRLQSPTGLAIHNGELYVVEQSHKEVSVFTLDGVYVRKFAIGGGLPEKIAIDAAGNCYVTDSTEDTVKKYDAAGAFVMEWGGTGSGDGQLNTPMGITFDANGDIWVNDRFNYRFVKYDTDGNQLFATTRDTWDNTGATDLVFGPDGMIYATMWAQNYNRVSVFDTDGALQRWSTSYQGPQGIGMGPNGILGVVSWNFHQAYLLESGDPMTNLETWGSQGGDPELFQYPLDIVIEGSGDIFICDKSLHTVKVFTSSLVPTTESSLGGVKAMFR